MDCITFVKLVCRFILDGALYWMCIKSVHDAPMRDDLDSSLVRPEDLPGYRRVAAQLRQEIVDGHLPAGSWLRLQSIAKRLNVSIQPVREALQQLEGEGLLQILPNRGAQVRGVDRQRLINLFEIRAALEPMLAARFCEACTMSDIRRIEAVQARHDACIIARDRPGTSAANAEFHHLINAGAHNEDARLIVERYYDLNRSLHVHQPIMGDVDQLAGHHHDLIAAFRRRDPVAAREISAAHIRQTMEMLFSLPLGTPELPIST